MVRGNVATMTDPAPILRSAPEIRGSALAEVSFPFRLGPDSRRGTNGSAAGGPGQSSIKQGFSSEYRNAIRQRLPDRETGVGQPCSTNQPDRHGPKPYST